jgi:hypothetical protein
MSTAQVPGFETLASEADWFTGTLGGAVLPGVVTVHGLKVGIDCDTKKAKGSDQPTSTDNGLDPSKFEIRVWMNSAHYAIWQRVLPAFNPRRPGRDRGPLVFLHPATIELGIRNVRVLTIEAEQPSGRQGFVRVLKCEEWFDKPKPVPKKPANKVRPQDSFDYKHFNEAISLGGGTVGMGAGTVGLWGQGVRTNNIPTNEEIDPNTFQSQDPSSTENILRTFLGDRRRDLSRGPTG